MALDQLRERAAAVGCDGIVFQGATGRDKGEAELGYAATCFVYRQ